MASILKHRQDIEYDVMKTASLKTGCKICISDLQVNVQNIDKVFIATDCEHHHDDCAALWPLNTAE